MKATELRIGNFVHHKDDWSYRQPDNGPFVGFDFAWEERDFYALVECVLPRDAFEPIPLTEEWLLKFGFEYKGTCDDFMEGYYKHQNLENVCFDHTFEPAVTGNDWGATYISRFDMKYVHQLQNLYFALTGEELTVKTQ